MQLRATNPQFGGNGLDRLGIRRARFIGQDETDVNVADKFAESAVREASEGKGSDQTVP